jgi:hypothetical protein
MGHWSTSRKKLLEALVVLSGLVLQILCGEPSCGTRLSQTSGLHRSAASAVHESPHPKQMNVWRSVVRRLLESRSRRHPEEDYELLSSEPNSRPGLPIANGHQLGVRRRTARGIFFSILHFFTLRRTLIFFALIPFLVALAILLQGIPPGYEDIRTYERHLPQHNLSAAKDGMYLRFPGHLWGHGLNNILQEA